MWGPPAGPGSVLALGLAFVLGLAALLLILGAALLLVLGRGVLGFVGLVEILKMVLHESHLTFHGPIVTALAPGHTCPEKNMVQNRPAICYNGTNPGGRSGAAAVIREVSP